jgi:UDP-glucose 4-epimerase
MLHTVFVTGAAGFIGSNLVDRLLADGQSVIGWDNLSTGQPQFLDQARTHPGFRFIQGDTLDLPALTQAMQGCDFVFHLAANADVRFGTEHPRKDLEQNTIATFNVLEAMRANGIRRVAFSSTGSIYGEPEVHPTPETAPFPVQTSLYGASKLAGEGLLQAYAGGFGFQVFIFRFVSILGERYTHGHVFDFYKKLLANPHEIEVLGNGKQRKSYLYVQDCLSAMLTVIDKSSDGVNIYNLGADEYCNVDQSLGWITAHLGLNPTRRYTGGDRGWIGDSPFIFLDTQKVRALGWRPTLSIRDAVIRTLDYLQQESWVLQQR